MINDPKLGINASLTEVRGEGTAVNKAVLLKKAVPKSVEPAAQALTS